MVNFQKNQNTTGIIFMIGAMAGFALEDLFMKKMGDFWSPMQILLVIGFLGGLAYAIIARMQGINVFDRKLLDRNALLRMCFEVIGTLAFASSVILGSVSLASTIIQAMPLLVTMGAAIFLGEKVGWRRWSAIFVGLFGVMLVMEPWSAEFSPYTLLAFIGVIGLSARDLVTRVISANIPSISLATWGFWALVPTCFILMLFGQNFSLSATDISWTLLLSIIGALLFGLWGYYLLIRAMRIGDIAVITPFRYSRLIFGGLIGVTVFGESLSVSAMIGAAIILCTGLYTFMRERKLKEDA